MENLAVNAKPAKELKRFALREKLSKEGKEKEATWPKPAWPKPSSQSSDYSDDQSSGSRDSRRRSKAKKMPKSFITAPIIIEETDRDSESQSSPPKLRLTEKADSSTRYSRGKGRGKTESTSEPEGDYRQQVRKRPRKLREPLNMDEIRNEAYEAWELCPENSIKLIGELIRNTFVMTMESGLCNGVT